MEIPAIVPVEGITSRRRTNIILETNKAAAAFGKLNRPGVGINGRTKLPVELSYVSAAEAKSVADAINALLQK